MKKCEIYSKFLQDGQAKTYAQITQKKKEEREAKAAAAAAAAAAEKAEKASSPSPSNNVEADLDNTKKIVKDTAVKHNQHVGKCL